MGVDALAVCQGAELGVFPAAGLLGFSHQVAVECLAAFHQLLVITLCCCEHVEDGLVAVAVPVGAEVLAKVLDRIDVVVTYQNVAFLASFDGLDYRHAAFGVVALDYVEVAAVYEGLAQLLACADAGLSACCAHVEPAPVYAQVVTFAGQDVLRSASGLYPDAAVLLEGFRVR